MNETIFVHDSTNYIYICLLYTSLLALWHRAKDLARDYNLTNSSDTKRKSELLNELLGKVGNQLWITPPFHVDYGCNIYFGNNCEVNMNCTFLDDNKIIIGDNVLIAPNVQIYTAYHPTHYLDRFTISENETFNFCKTQTAPVIIGKNVWIGGGTIILPGVTIGDNTVIGAGKMCIRDRGTPSQIVITIIGLLVYAPLVSASNKAAKKQGLETAE